MLADWACSLGVTLIEIPQSTPSYPLNQTVTRFPPQALQDALLAQVQEIIPLVKIVPKQTGYPAICVSDRRCTIGSQLYQARLLEFDGISQSIGNEADEVRFVFGNADRVLRDLANDVDLYRAALEFSLFHVGTGIKLDLWKGEIIDWSFDAGPEFQVRAADGIYELNLPYPTRRISRTCWKRFKDGVSCPYEGPHTSCDNGYETPNGCVAHGMQRYFGGILAEPRGVRIKDNSTGVWGFGRSTITSVSLVAESIYDQVVPEIYTDSEMPVNAKIAAGRDESDFYNALTIVGEGPLGAYGTGHSLDGQYHHGYPDPLGLREVLGSDPAGATECFALGQDYKPVYAAGTAFLELRRADAKGLQLYRVSEHELQAVVRQGLSGWIWTAPGERSLEVLTNPIWIAVNMLLRARGLRFADPATCEQFFDVNAAIAAAAICEEQVQPIFQRYLHLWVPPDPNIEGELRHYDTPEVTLASIPSGPRGVSRNNGRRKRARESPVLSLALLAPAAAGMAAQQRFRQLGGARAVRVAEVHLAAGVRVERDAHAAGFPKQFEQAPVHPLGDLTVLGVGDEVVRLQRIFLEVLQLVDVLDAVKAHVFVARRAQRMHGRRLRKVALPVILVKQFLPPGRGAAGGQRQQAAAGQVSGCWEPGGIEHRRHDVQVGHHLLQHPPAGEQLRTAHQERDTNRFFVRRALVDQPVLAEGEAVVAYVDDQRRVQLAPPGEPFHGAAQALIQRQQSFSVTPVVTLDRQIAVVREVDPVPTVALVVYPGGAVARHLTRRGHGGGEDEAGLAVAALVALGGDEIGMHGLVGKVQEKGLILLSCAEPLEGVVGQLVGDVAPLGHPAAVDVQPGRRWQVTSLSPEAHPVVKAGLRLIRLMPICHLPMKAVA